MSNQGELVYNPVPLSIDKGENRLATAQNFRPVRLWLTVAAVCLAWTEFGRLTGAVPQAVLDGLHPAAPGWWDLPGVVHAPALAAASFAAWFAGRGLLAGVTLPRTPAGRVLAVAVGLLGLYLCLNQFGELGNVTSRVTDFGTIHRGSAALFAGIDPYEATQAGYFYPPLLAFLFGPLTLVPPAGASLVFFTLKLVMLAWTLTACDRLVQGGRFTAGRRVLFVFGLIFVASRFWLADMQYGNTNVVILFLVTAAIVWDLEDRTGPAGLALALAVAIKITPVVLLLHFLVRARWRTLAFFAAGMAALLLLPWTVLQGHWWDAWRAYGEVGVAGKLNERLAQPDNQSLWGFANRTFPETRLAVLRVFWFGIVSLLGLFAGLVSWRSRGRDGIVAVAAAALYPLLSLLASPGSWVVHYTAALPAMAVLWSLALSRRMPGRWAWPLLAVTNVAFTASGWARASVHASITQSWFVAAAVMLLAGLGAWTLSQGRIGGEPGETD